MYYRNAEVMSCPIPTVFKTAQLLMSLAGKEKKIFLKMSSEENIGHLAQEKLSIPEVADQTKLLSQILHHMRVRAKCFQETTVHFTKKGKILLGIM